MLKKIYSLKRKEDFKNVLKKGKGIYVSGLGIKVLENRKSHPRFGIIISAKVSKKATERNKLRRRIRYIFYKNLERIKNLDIVVITQNSIIKDNFKQLEKKVLKILKKLNAFKNF